MSTSEHNLIVTIFCHKMIGNKGRIRMVGFENNFHLTKFGDLERVFKAPWALFAFHGGFFLLRHDKQIHVKG